MEVWENVEMRKRIMKMNMIETNLPIIFFRAFYENRYHRQVFLKIAFTGYSHRIKFMLFHAVGFDFRL